MAWPMPMPIHAGAFRRNEGREESFDKRAIQAWVILNPMTKITYPVLARLFYAAVWCLALPISVAYLLYRGIAQPVFRQGLGERFSCYRVLAEKPIWLHAASLGEVNAATPLLLALRADYPDIDLLITCQTPAGRQRAQELAINRCRCIYLPFDLRFLTQRFMRHFQPRLALIFETEIWPNLFLSAKQSDIPLLVINARLTERSVRRYARFSALFARALALPDAILCQTYADARRFIQAGASSSTVTMAGNLKWDTAVDPQRVQAAMRERLQWPQRPVWMAVSTHEQEEPMVLDAHRKILARWPQALLLWAPRHVERFQPCVALAARQDFAIGTRSADVMPPSQAQVFLIDSHGELGTFMPCAEAVFVGGSLQAIGGHNVLEPAALGLPIIVGPHTRHFAEIVALLAESNALLQVPDAETMADSLLDLLSHPERASALGRNALACVAQSRGALEKTKALVAQRLVSG
jgi:3-deoxy-D-manno-octulosonic-acid transferase